MKNILTICALVFLLAACGQDTEKEELSTAPASVDLPVADNEIIVTKEQFAMGEMETGSLSSAVFPFTISANGVIDVPPKSRAAVSVYYGGYIKGLDLLPGQRIRKGQVLFTLENPDFVQMQQDYLESKAQLGYLESDFERQKTLAAENIASQKNFLKAESDFQVQQARIEGLKKKLQMLGVDIDRVEGRDFVSTVAIYAPISGFITRVNASSGSFLNASDVALEITSTDHLHLELDVFEKDVHLLREGQKIQFRVPGSKGVVYGATVHLIGSIVEGENRIVRVHGHLEDERNQNGLIPGMYVEAMIETAIDSVMALPESAVVSLEEDAYILVQRNQSAEAYTFERQLVETGRTVNGMTEIRSAIDVSDPVLIKGAFNLIME
ncbi:efflux RND transporter periplasmic adaptor subunit [Flavilitoribacter nigricans]|uniref:Efflux transporter periplasmic adaptor subunit n=1 Tax=Flavilitoribacter nigricans (strain ATCC 23147 / DSM 23189 / NBRC 102662 / NCIMB 1420 / SS-2) TaxID=1122177 RepID=A0A2D0NEX2_FLAN2|nr:efflux RND transporter periplasmic adaptor subunit [Flavilitoribacter nigricans]PHN06333.1 efflux transporter periplasmic adaptor subunit [Flavilitoribacter nigricans DSM 23189 = NBRC 102662]